MVDIDTNIPGFARPALTGPDLAAYEEAAFADYQRAFHRNVADPSLRNAAELVRAWNRFAMIVGVDALDTGVML